MQHICALIMEFLDNDVDDNWIGRLSIDLLQLSSPARVRMKILYLWELLYRLPGSCNLSLICSSLFYPQHSVLQLVLSYFSFIDFIK